MLFYSEIDPEYVSQSAGSQGLPEQKFHLFEVFSRKVDGVVAVKTGRTEIMRTRDYLFEAFDTQIRQGIRGYILFYFIYEMG